MFTFKKWKCTVIIPMTSVNVDTTLDSILEQLDEFGNYQIIIFSLVCIAVVLHSGVHVAFVFTAMDVPYRCWIPECDSGYNYSDYDQHWVPYAVPHLKDNYRKCEMYAPISNETFENCTLKNFNTSKIIECHDYFFKTDEWSILQEYGLYCERNLWKLALVGTVNNIGQFFGLFTSGIVSDKFGRKIVLIWGMIFCSIFGIIRTLAPTYEWFLALEFLDAFFGAGTYACGFIMAVELVGPKKRLISGSIACCSFPFGEIFAAVAAWLVRSWRPTIYIVYAPPLLLFFYIWIIPESIRWCLSKGKLEEAKVTLRRIAKFNKKELKEETLDKLDIVLENNAKDERRSVKHVLKSKILLLRFFNCCFCWINCAFLFYGLTLNSVTLSGDSYQDFILTSLIEIPAYLSCTYLVGKFGRRTWQAAAYAITAVSCLAFIFINEDILWARICVYLLGKFGTTAAFTTNYVISSELFPTPFRHSLMGLCSTIARIGSIIAPQTPLLIPIWPPLPLIIFSVLATLAAVSTMFFPETLNIKLPDTIEEAELIGKKVKATS